MKETVEFQMVHNLVESNGKTIKQNNLEIKHSIPLKTFVEVNCDCSESHGCRGFVVDYQRDCDGEPLYGISFTPETVGYLEAFRKPQSDPQEDTLNKAFLKLTQAQVNGGWSVDSLIVIHHDKVDK